MVQPGRETSAHTTLGKAYKLHEEKDKEEEKENENEKEKEDKKGRQREKKEKDKEDVFTKEKGGKGRKHSCSSAG